MTGQGWTFLVLEALSGSFEPCLKNYANLLKKMGREGEAAGLEARVEAVRGKVRGSEEGK